MKKRVIHSIVIFFLLICISTHAQEAGRQIAADTDLHYKYLLYLPTTYGQTEEEFPLILFLHGAGERGANLNAVKTHGPPKIVNNERLLGILYEDGVFPFVVVSPQCPAGEWWLNKHLIEVLVEVIDNYAIDANRIYLTGLSMGGFGSWSFASEYPQYIAAIAPISGGGDALHWPNLRTYTNLDPSPAIVENLVDIPVWAFHGESDTVVSLSEDQKTVNRLLEIGGSVEFTVYPNTGHDAWTKTYNTLELYQWLLSNKKKSDSSTDSWAPYP
ncbi:MAG: prolyl oligopeptidase family serine peptidase [Candidatus Omnitrophica bacterium]|nr:prolyl oligopeptidase family serine peptidase [Candidatus Omnitrophota bacterium]